MKDCIVLGAGMVGVGTALALQQMGVDVTLVDRRAPGEETSYGNAGVIQVEAVEPYAFPRGFGEIVSAAFGRDPSVRWQAGSLHRWALPLMRYFVNSSAKKHRRISTVYSQMIRRAGDDHTPLIDAAGARSLIRQDGLRQVYRSARTFEIAARDAERLSREYGVASKVETSDELAAQEAGLKTALAGALLWTEPMSCADPGELVAAYARLFATRGGTLAIADATSLRAVGAGWQVEGRDGAISAENVVVALGPWSGELLRRLGYRVPLFFKRGYHQHFTGAGPALPLMDADRGVVIAPMKRGVRVLTGVEIAWLESPSTAHQMRAARRSASELFDLGDPVEDTAWFGNRPCMPGMLPVVGRAPRHKGLWLNFGHGHQGFTLGPTTGRMLAGEMAGNEKLPDELTLAA